ncbi:caspase family protein [Desulfovibrio inopinatus]|uniref:caspase family protein n=1 Tax=Desulfovibrio inopinatus TaxID=102109 RepID=UPI0004194130|nr:caspase family protein [Desulfovibrio inopinatus]
MFFSGLSRCGLVALLALCVFSCPAAGGEAAGGVVARSFILSIGVCVPYFAPPAPACCSHGPDELIPVLSRALGTAPEDLRRLTNQQAHYDAVINDLVWLAESSRPDDIVIIYYFGHGLLLPNDDGSERDGQDEVLSLWSAQEPFCVLEAVLTKKWLLDDELGRLLDAIPATRKLLIADTCHGGAAQRLAISDEQIMAYDAKTAALMAAAQPNQNAFLSPQTCVGLFTHALTEAIRNGAPNMEAAFTSARRTVMRERPKQPNALKVARRNGQTPTLTDPEGLSRMILLAPPGTPEGATKSAQKN